jgi:2-polyprenyl-6-methoxyphenol hydroxylase-like FAD-dependent oxidoreductase
MSIQGRTVPVAGGGIAGMAVWLLLGNAGALVTMIERFAEPEAAGAGPAITVQLGSEVMAARPDGRLEVSGPGGTRVLTSEYRTRLGLFGGVAVDRASTYFFALANAPAVAQAVAARDLPAFRELWSRALPPSSPALDRVASWDELLVIEVRRVDCERWADGRLVLVGDAAHAMAPNLGQGANSALVDAAVLSVELAVAQPMEQALARYAQRRRPSAACRTPPTAWLAPAACATRRSPGAARRRSARCGTRAGPDAAAGPVGAAGGPGLALRRGPHPRRRRSPGLTPV